VVCAGCKYLVEQRSEQLIDDKAGVTKTAEESSAVFGMRPAILSAQAESESDTVASAQWFNMNE
jgi:hypothetical protein